MHLRFARTACSLLVIFAPVAAGLVAPGCGGSATTGNGAAGVTGGDPCDVDGETADAADGCNTCVCDAGAWTCTEVACGTSGAGGGSGTCTPGESRAAEDDCNVCTCGASGDWGCTKRACLDAGTECADGEVRWSECSVCSCVGGVWACSHLDFCGDGGKACVDGEQRVEDCNVCTCSAGAWACTMMACEDAGPGEDGGTADAGPGEVQCGGWLGDTCAPSEFCAYVEGQMCGAADASAVCRPRPQTCPGSYAPVCGCDNATYSNACAANAAGTGVYHDGPC